MNNKKIAVTGATGMVGGYLVAELLRCGATDIVLPVRNLARLENMYRILQREGVDREKASFTVVNTDLTDPLALKETFSGVDIVFNCAASVSLGAMDDELLVEGNIEITKHVVNASLEAGVGRLVHVSSTAALSTVSEDGKEIDETMLPESVAGLPSYYAGKLLSENEVWRGAASGLRVTVVNPGMTLGLDDRHMEKGKLVTYMVMGIPFYTNGATAMVDVHDVARAMVGLSQNEGAVGERYILSGGNISFREFLTLSAKAAGKTPPRIRASRFMLGVGWRGAWLWGKLKKRRLLFTSDIPNILLARTHYSTEKIGRFAGFEFTPLSITIDRMVKEFLAEKKARKNG